MLNLYGVTFKFNRPVRSNLTVQVTATSEAAIRKHPEISEPELTKKGYSFGEYAYNDQPVKIELLEKNVS